MKKINLIQPQDLCRGHVISIPGTKTYGLVFDVDHNTDSGQPVSFRYLPIHEADEAPNNRTPNRTSENVFEFWHSTKLQFGLPPKKNFTLTYILKDYNLSAEKAIFGFRILERTGYQKATAGIFRRMNQILESENLSPEALSEAPALRYPLRMIPSHIKNSREPSCPEVMNITLTDAVKLQILTQGIVDILTATSKNHQMLSTLREAFQYSTTPEFPNLVSKGIKTTNITLSDAFAAGVINESEVIEALKPHGITGLADAIDAIESADSVMQSINKAFINDLSSTTTMVRFFLRSAWEKLGKMVASNDGKLLQSGIRYMHPERR